MTVVMVMILLACGVIGIVVGDPSFDTSELVLSSTDTSGTPADVDARNLLASKAAKNSDWFADDSAQGTRPDASH
ncbi:MAG: hypothetical protein ACR2GP_06305 [Burkholderiaceae bacterium]